MIYTYVRDSALWLSTDINSTLFAGDIVLRVNKIPYMYHDSNFRPREYNKNCYTVIYYFVITRTGEMGFAACDDLQEVI